MDGTIKCSLCHREYPKIQNEESPQIYVWVVPDPYYGYGHLPKIICQKCEFTEENLPKILGNLWYEKLHAYRPDVDDYHLPDQPKKNPIDWCWIGGRTDNIKCHRCLSPYDSGRAIMIDVIFENIDNQMIMHEVGKHYLCQKCALNIWMQDDDFIGFRDKLYCCSQNPLVEVRKFYEKEKVRVEQQIKSGLKDEKHKLENFLGAIEKNEGISKYKDR